MADCKWNPARHTIGPCASFVHAPMWGIGPEVSARSRPWMLDSLAPLRSACSLVRSLFHAGEEEFEPNFPIALNADAI